MEAAIKFAVNGPNIESAFNLLRGGHSVPAALFINLMTEKFQLINKHLHSTRNYLMITATVNNAKASVKFHDLYFEDSELCHMILSNLPDLKDQLIYLWTKMRDLPRHYHIDDHDAELVSIDTFYSDLEYDALVQANFMDF